MIEFLKVVPVWFLVLSVIVLGAGFIGTLKLLFASFKKSLDASFSVLNETLKRFELLFEKLFDKHEDLEVRLSRLEGAHNTNHKGGN